MEHQYQNKEVNQSDFDSFNQNHILPVVAVVGAVSAIVSAGKVAVNAIVGVGENVAKTLGIDKGAANHDQQNIIASKWTSGEIDGAQGAVNYMIAWFDGVGSSQWDHIKNLKSLRKTMLDSQDPSKIGDYNSYLKSWIDGVGSPVPVECLSATVYAMTKSRPAIYAELEGYGQGKKIPTDEASQKLYCSLDYLTSVNSSSSTPPSQTTVPVTSSNTPPTVTGGDNSKISTGTIIMIAGFILVIVFFAIKNK